MKTTRTDGLINARAVGIFRALDEEIQRTTDGEADLFALAREMMRETDPIDLERLRAMARELTGSPEIQALKADRVPGFKPDR